VSAANMGFFKKLLCCLNQESKISTKNI